MGKRSRYEPGTFCWVDLATTDPESAKAFYGELFGWGAEDMPAGEGFTYSMMNLDGDTICGLYEMDDERRSQGAPPYWLSYVSVEDAGEAAAKAKELGGEVVEEAFDVMDSGRMAVISDPEGAILPLWQPKDSIGAGRVNDTGCLAWNELQTRDHESAASFYGDLFGWKASPIEENGSTVYVTSENKESMNGGIMPMTEDHGDAAPQWLPYFTTENLDASVAKIEDLGGQTILPPMEVPPDDRIAVFTDPQGATFALFEGRTDD